ncbi:tRNA glutamyl-Q(34) synthetase GluQRS [Sagittula sp. SSi028]|uniref:tRNA glutamyl-Q(34) synthetase GluQRS n=1 Tax=Sagittula sp. SSi028 TaxID=3400636 RepID=UPI003AF6628F
MITRFAPSPTGPLHLGHAYSAMLAFDMAQAAGGVFHVRIDDLDQSRSRAAWEAQIYDDLHWLGLSWPTPCRRESEHLADYDVALDRLWQMGLLYPCHCSRRDIRDALNAPQEAAVGPDGLVYPGTCKPAFMGPDRPRPRDVTLRLDMTKACAFLNNSSDLRGFHEAIHADPRPQIIANTKSHLIQNVGDVVLARRDMGAAYHLAVVVDDAAQLVTDVVRGQDLFEATRIHVLLQQLLGLPTPRYHHHMLIRDDMGKRLAKRDDARAIATYRDDGHTPADIRRMVGLPVA